jgi:crotonobetainyl-CoA:carnitine CoA-transferase CaiB-like acyl-CoA transferase
MSDAATALPGPPAVPSPPPAAWPANPLLQGVRVLDLSRLLPGPMCSLYLAQLGADVLKIEDSSSGGDYARVLAPELFALVNRGKRSMALNLRDDADRAAFLEQVQTADVVLESFRPGVLARCGCGPDVLLAANPRLVLCSLTGYGQTGPYADRVGHDLNYAGLAGVLDQAGAPGGPPQMGNFPTADIAGGALTALAAILAALRGVAAGGPGVVLDVSMVEGLAALQVVHTATQRTLGHAQPRGADLLSGALPTYSVYACADGGWVSFAAVEPKFFFEFCRVVERPDLLKLPLAPGAAGSRLREALAALFASQPRAHWTVLLAATGACVAPVLSPDEALQDEHLRARGLFGTDDKGRPEAAFPVCFDGRRLPAVGPAPAVPARSA